jgi:hypothetical protein
MPPLKRIKQEQFARAVIESGSQTEAYQKVYGVDYDVAKSNASDSLSKPNVRARVMELLTENKAGLSDVSKRIAEHVHGENAPVSLSACQTVLKVAGAMDEAEKSQASYNPTMIVIRKIVVNQPMCNDTNNLQS